MRICVVFPSTKEPSENDDNSGVALSAESERERADSKYTYTLALAPPRAPRYAKVSLAARHENATLGTPSGGKSSSSSGGRLKSTSEMDREKETDRGGKYLTPPSYDLPWEGRENGSAGYDSVRGRVILFCPLCVCARAFDDAAGRRPRYFKFSHYTARCE